MSDEKIYQVLAGSHPVYEIVDMGDVVEIRLAHEEHDEQHRESIKIIKGALPLLIDQLNEVLKNSS